MSRISSRLGGVRVDRLLSFIAVVESGGFTAAAAATHLSQPQISRHIAELEAAVGSRLIDRSAKPVALTAAGARFHTHAITVVGALEQATLESEEYAKGIGGTLRIGMYPSAASFLFPALHRDLAERFPAIDLQLWEGMPHELEPALTQGEVDMIVHPGALVPGRDLRTRLIWKEPLVAVYQSEDELSEQVNALELRHLEGRPLVVTGNPHAQPAPQSDVMMAFEAEAVTPTVVMRTDLPQTLVAMVGCGIGVGVINSLALRNLDLGELQVKVIQGERCIRTVTLAWLQPASSPRTIVQCVLDSLDSAPNRELVAWR